MPIYHLSVKPISRSSGRSATAAAAYRAGELIHDQRTGEVFDYTRRGGVDKAGTGVVLPAGAEWQPSRAELWNAAEAAERRKDACVAREHEVALPAELTAEQRLHLVQGYAQALANQHGCAVDFAIHAPSRHGDQRNWHAHILMTTRKVEGLGLGPKCDREKAGRNRKADLTSERAAWERAANLALQRAGSAERIDHRSLADQGITRIPSKHLGAGACAFERRTGEASRRRQDLARERRDEWKERRHLRRETLGPRNLAMALNVEVRTDRRIHRWGGKGPSAGYAAVVQRGAVLTAAGRYTQKKIEAMAYVAKQSGWSRMRLNGTAEFKAMAARELLRRGVEVTNPELRPLLERIRAELKQQAAPQQGKRSEGRAAVDATPQVSPWGKIRDFFFAPQPQLPPPKKPAPIKSAPKPQQRPPQPIIPVPVTPPPQPAPRAVKKEMRHDRDHHPSRDQEPATLASLRDVWGVDNVHDLGRSEDVLQPHAPHHLRRGVEAEPDHSDLHKLGTGSADSLSPTGGAKASLPRVERLSDQAFADQILASFHGDRLAAIRAVAQGGVMVRALGPLAGTENENAIKALIAFEGDVARARERAETLRSWADAVPDLQRIERELQEAERDKALQSVVKKTDPGLGM